MIDHPETLLCPYCNQEKCNCHLWIPVIKMNRGHITLTYDYCLHCGLHRRRGSKMQWVYSRDVVYDGDPGCKKKLKKKLKFSEDNY